MGDALRSKEMILGVTFVLRETLLRVGRLHSYKNSAHSFLCEIYTNAAICALLSRNTHVLYSTFILREALKQTTKMKKSLSVNGQSYPF